MPRLTAVTIAKDEEAHIARAFRSVQGLADEIAVVVDAGTADRTVEIARQFTDKVFVRPWAGYGPQKNFALEQATGDWALFLDADEEVTPQLAKEIRTVIQQQGQLRGHPEAPSLHSRAGSDRRISAPPTEILRGVYPERSRRAQDDRPSVFFVRIITVFLGRPLEHLWGTNPRLLRRGAAAWNARRVHEQVVRPDGSVVRLGDFDTDLLHASLLHPSHYETLAAYRERRERYTTRDAEEMLAAGKDRLGKPVGDALRTPLLRARFLAERAAKQFIRLFVKKRGFLDGWQGWLWIWLSAQYEYMVAKKYLALLGGQRQKNESSFSP